MPTFDAHNNFAYETVTTAPSPGTSGTTIVIGTTNFAQFPDPSSAAYNVVCWPAGTIPLASNAEVLRVVTKGTNGTVEVTRAQESSTNRNIGTGDQFAMNITQKSVTDIENYLTNTSSGAELNAPVIGTATITGGTATNTVLNTNTVGTPAVTGGTATNTVLNNNTVGTPNITDGTADLQSLDLNTTTAVTAIRDEDDMSSNDATGLSTQQSIKAYVDASAPGHNRTARAYRGSAQTITNNTQVKVQLDTESWDPGNDFDNSTNYRYTAPVAGKYLIVGQVEWPSASTTDGKVYWTQIRVNNAQVAAQYITAAVSNVGFSVQASAIVDLAATDYVELFCLHNVGSDKDINPDDTFMSICLLTTA